MEALRIKINKLCTKILVSSSRGALAYYRVFGEKKKFPWYFNILSKIEFKTRGKRRE